MDTYAYLCLLAAAFTMSFSLPAGRGFIAITMILLIRRFIRDRKPLVMPATAWLAVVYFAVAVLATALGPSPALGFSMISKLLWYLSIPVFATVIVSYRHLSAVLAAYVLGAGTLSIMTLIKTPIRGLAAFVTDKTMGFGEAVHVLWTMPHGQIQIAMDAVRAGKTTDFMSCLVATGSMTDAQRLMVGIALGLGLVFICRAEGRSSRMWWFMVALQCVALLLNFKRGSWICAVGAAVIFLGFRFSWRHALACVVLVAAIVALPPVRDRLTDLRLEFIRERGGRLEMWTKITPELVKRRPWFGVGYRCVTAQLMKKIDRAVEGNRNHLHSNICEVLVETGVIGFVVYLLWMGMALRDAVRFVVRTRAGPVVEAVQAQALLLALLAVVANGIVEYNFSDAGIILIYGLTLGGVAAGCLRLSARSVRPA